MIRWLLPGLAVLSASAALAAEVLDKPVQWRTATGGNGHWYQAVFVPERINWVEAHLRATRRGCGWHLATIATRSEDRFVFGLIANRDRFFVVDSINGPWIGGFQKNSLDEPAGNWRWVTGLPFRYANWDGGEPNNRFIAPAELGPGVIQPSNEDFLHYKRIRDSRGDIPVWNDQPGNVLLPGYLTEREDLPCSAAAP
jgi:hypothetical protein